MGRRGEARTHVTQESEATIVGENVMVLQQEQGDNLMFWRVLPTPKKNTIEEVG